MPEFPNCPYCHKSLENLDWWESTNDDDWNDIDICPHCELPVRISCSVSYDADNVSEEELYEYGFEYEKLPDNPNQKYFPFTSKDELKKNYNKIVKIK